MADSSPSKHPRAILVIAMALAAVAVAAVHWPALDSKAVSFDDEQYFVDNSLVRNPSMDSTWRFLREVLEPSTVNGYYQPLTMISLMLDSAMGATPQNLRPLHRTSLAVHVANTLLVIFLLYMVFDSVLAASCVGLLFGLHPMTVETIPWLGERKTLLATFFALLAMVAYLRQIRVGERDKPAAKAARGDRPKSMTNPWYYACLIFFVLALLAKPTVTPLPLMLALMDVWPLKRFGRRALLEKLPFFVVAGVSAIVTFVSQARTADVSLPSQNGAMHAPLMICHNLIFYLGKIVFPVRLSSHYPMPDPFDLSDPSILTGVIGLCILTPILLLSLRWTRALMMGWLMFFVGLLPTMQIVGFTNVVASDKYAYFPVIGLLFILTWAISAAPRKGPRRTAAIVVFLLAVALGAVEARGSRNYYHVAWRDTETLYRYMIALAPRAPSLRSHLGNQLLDAGRVDEAIEEHLRAVQVGADRPEAHNDLGNALREKGLLDDAIRAYETALQVFPDYAIGHRNLGVALADKARAQEAVAHFKEAVRLKHRNPEGHYCWGIVLLREKRSEEAVEQFRKALAFWPNYAEANTNLGIALDSLGRRDEALTHFEAAVRAKPEFAEGRYNLAQALIGRGRMTEAAEQLREMLRISPEDADAQRTLEEITRK